MNTDTSNTEDGNGSTITTLAEAALEHVENDATDLEWASRRLAIVKRLDEDPRSAHVTTLIQTADGESLYEVGDPARNGAWIRTDSAAEVRR